MTQIKRNDSVNIFTPRRVTRHHPSRITIPHFPRKKRQRSSFEVSTLLIRFCCFGTLVWVIGSVILLFPVQLDRFSWRYSHHSNPDIKKLQHIFPIHVRDDKEQIHHPGFQHSDQSRLAAVFDGLSISKTIDVPRFWDPPVYGGVREFLGNNGEYLITKEEASAIGSTYNGRETIFVVVASYRDPECRSTVEDIFLRANYPERIRVGVIDQRSLVDMDLTCGQPAEPCERNPTQAFCQYGHLIDYLEYDAQLMVGPTFARHLGHRMYRGEYFIMQVDSHVRFVTNWDQDIINQWKSIGNEMAVLSTYLSDITNSIDPTTHQSVRESRTIMCNAEFEWKGDSKEHIKYNIQPSNKPHIKVSPMLHPFWAAGFSFARGHFGVQVPYDPHLPFVFQGEEISMTVRGFTYGYDYYAPVRNVAYHIYATRDNRWNVKTFTENAALFPGAKDEAYHRLNGIIGTGKSSVEFNHLEETRYGLGRIRMVDTYYRTFGIHVDTSDMEKGLCNFVQGVGGHISMHETFSPYLRHDGMGIDYDQINFEYQEQVLVDSSIDPKELASLRERLRGRQM